METKHTIYYKDARKLDTIESESINLVVTSPPYPMIAMWDEVFTSMDKKIGNSLKKEDGDTAYQLMHNQLRLVWQEVSRVLKPGGFACINIGDATRSIGKVFKMYPNHVDILHNFMELGFHILPEILWRKPTNSPTKFMGSGTLPCGAYVTLEHERILIFRKPTPRKFSKEEEKLNRRESAFFWEERNKWFSDIWDLTGEKQGINSKQIRKRSGAFPLEIPYRLILMYSSKGDTVLDPFNGTATTTLAAIISARNSIGFELDSSFKKLHKKEIPSEDFLKQANKKNTVRIETHLKEMKEYSKKGSTPKHINNNYDFPVVTRQEVDIMFEKIDAVKYIKPNDYYLAQYLPLEKSAIITPQEHRSHNANFKVHRLTFNNTKI